MAILPKRPGSIIIHRARTFLLPGKQRFAQTKDRPGMPYCEILPLYTGIGLAKSYVSGSLW